MDKNEIECFYQHEKWVNIQGKVIFAKNQGTKYETSHEFNYRRLLSNNSNKITLPPLAE